MTPIEESLKELASLSAKLHKETDDLNKVIEDLQERLAAANVGVSVWLPTVLVEFDPVKGATFGWQLGYEKLPYHDPKTKAYVADRWQLAVRKVTRSAETDADGYLVHDPEVASEHATRLLDAPRVVRVEAAAELEDLVLALTKKVSKFIKNIEKAKAFAKK